MKKSAEINVTPYIDILLVLLIIFMVIQPLDQYDLEARVAEKSSDIDDLVKNHIRPVFDTVVVSVDRDGNLSINGDRASEKSLGPKLFHIYSARRSKNMFVRGVSELPFEAIVRIIDIAKGAGVGDIGLVTEDQIPPAGS